MGVSSKDRAFNTKKVSYLDFKQLEMDRVLTALFARLAHNGYPSRLKRRFELSVEAFVDEFLEHPSGSRASPSTERSSNVGSRLT